MRLTLTLMRVALAAGVAVLASALGPPGTWAGQLPAGAAQAAAARDAAAAQPAAAAACTDMQATDIAWVTLKANHHIDKQVSAYASGTQRIVPVFQFSCAPDGATIVSVFSLNGQTIFTDQEAIPARSFPGLYAYSLETLDGTPLSDGQWGVQYFNDRTLLSSGQVQVGNSTGGDPAQTTSATVQGVVQDQASQSPIEGAVILVLNPGVKAQDFIANGQNENDVFASGKSDSQGAFTLTKKIARHTAYGMVVVAQGYKPLGSNTFQIADDPEPVSITIGMTK
jgi:hypothetical protein